MSDGREWFAPKRYGLGSGLPLRWQGWAVLLAYVAVIGGTVLLLGETNPVTFALLVIATVILLIITARTTRGGWRWRWGKDSE